MIRKVRTMNSVLEQIYATVLPSAPFVIAAYALLWAALLVFCIMLANRLSKSEKEIVALESNLTREETNKTASVLKED